MGYTLATPFLIASSHDFFLNFAGALSTGGLVCTCVYRKGVQEWSGKAEAWASAGAEAHGAEISDCRPAVRAFRGDDVSACAVGFPVRSGCPWLAADVPELLHPQVLQYPA